MDTNRPHDINQLIVGDLGNEEVVVVACDDGDVISYHVRSIFLAIDEGANIVFGPDHHEHQKLKRYGQSGWANLILPVVDPHSTPGFRILAAWFHENVGASAWGLATHKGNKLLAVSSNTKDINVFAPSLSSDLDRAASPEYIPQKNVKRYTAWETRNSSTLSDPFLCRQAGRKVTLRGHVTNIPNIAFCDNSLDSKGRYLASVDIDGHTFVWDIWGGTRIFENFENTGPRKSVTLPATRTYTHESGTRGWAVACLDPRTSRLRYVIRHLGTSGEANSKGRASHSTFRCFTLVLFWNTVCRSVSSPLFACVDLSWDQISDRARGFLTRMFPFLLLLQSV